MGASAQTTGSLVTGYGDPLTLTQFKALAGTSGRFALVASSNTAADNAPRCDHWMLFTSTYNTTTLSEEALFYLEESSTDLYKVKRSSDGLYVSTSTSSTEFNGTGSEFKLVNRDPNDATKAVEGEYSISFEDPTNSTMHYNANAVKYNNGAGAWTTYAVFGPIYKVTVKFKDTNNESIQPDATYFVKANTALNAPIVSGYAVQGTSSYTITSDETVTFTYNNAIPAFDPNDVDGKTFTLQCARGYVYYNGSELAGTSDASQASKFAVVSYDNNTYLYDATQKKFVCHTTAATADNTGNAALESNDDFSKAVKNISFGSTDIAAYPYYVQEDEFTNWLNMDASPLVFFNRWTNFESGNGGNTYKIEIVDTDFDDFEAVATLKFYLDQTITYSPALGSWSGTGDYSNQWTSSFTNPQLTLKTSDSSSNINKADGGLYSTNNSTTTYVLTVPNGYLITGYSFKATPSTGATGMSITPDGGSAIAIPAAGTTISKTGLTSASAQFIVNGRYVQVSDFEVTYSEDPNVIRDLSNLSNSKSYYIKTKNNARGALSTYTDNGTTYLASPVKSALGISAKKFAILSYENNYYLYSVEDAKFVTYESANNAPLAATVTGTADAVAFSATTAPLYELRFDNSASKILNSSANYAYGVVINNWGASSNQWDDGCQYSIEIADDFDATDALAALEAFFHPSNYYDRVEAEVIPFLQDGNQNPSPTIGKPFGLSSSAATSIVQTYMTQLNNQQFNQTEYRRSLHHGLPRR